jgi:hypothetical protein
MGILGMLWLRWVCYGYGVYVMCMVGMLWVSGYVMVMDMVAMLWVW